MAKPFSLQLNIMHVVHVYLALSKLQNVSMRSETMMSVGIVVSLKGTTIVYTENEAMFKVIIIGECPRDA